MGSSGVDSNKNVHPILVDSSGRPYILLSDGTDVPIFEVDDSDIAASQTTLTIICLNYVYDGVQKQWVRMTQP